VSARVSTLLDVGPRGGRYVFLLVEWNDYASDVRDELNRQAQAFALDLGHDGVLVQAFPQRMYEAMQQLLEKPWPADIRKRLDEEQDPIVLVFDQGWDSFDPRHDPYAVIWLAGFRDRLDAVPRVLHDLALRTRRGEDVITHLKEIAERRAQDAAEDRLEKDVGFLARLASYVELKPKIFGVSIDLSALLRDLGSRT
jgi:hypothetical protein